MNSELFKRWIFFATMLTLTLSSIIPDYASGLPEEDRPCVKCHVSDTTIVSLKLNSTSINVKPNQTFHIEVTGGFSGPSPSWVMKWPSTVDDNALFKIEPLQTSIYNDTLPHTVVFEISAPSDEGTYTLVIYASGKSEDGLSSNHENIAVKVSSILEDQTATQTTTTSVEPEKQIGLTTPRTLMTGFLLGVVPIILLVVIFIAAGRYIVQYSS